METIYKYRLDMIATQVIDMPADAEILCVQIQNGKPHLWAKVNTGNALVSRKIEFVGTGRLASQAQQYIGTFQTDSGALVIHVFEVSHED